MLTLPYEIGISPTLHIRGMIAAKDIKKGAILEKCPIIRIPKKEMPHLLQTVLQNYYFDWTREHHVIVLGYGSLINHSYTPNAAYKWDYKNKHLIMYAISSIRAGEEVMINYNGVPGDMSPLEEGLTNFNKHA